MYKWSLHKIITANIIVSVVLGGLFITPTHSVEAATQTREQMLTQIQQLILLISQLKAMIQDRNAGQGQQPYELKATGQHTIPAGTEVAISRLTAQPKNTTHYLNNADIVLVPVSGEDEPWKVFERVKVYVNGKELVNKFVANQSYWQKTQDGYRLGLFEGNVPMVAWGTYEASIAFVTGHDVPKSAWSGYVPNDGIVVWNKNEGHRNYGSNQKRISFNTETGTLSDALSCTLESAEETYGYNEAITLKWSSTNATYAKFVVDSSGKDYLTLPTKVFPAKGETTITAGVTGMPFVSLKVFDNKGNSAVCKTSFLILTSEDIKNGIVSDISPVGATFKINETIPVSWKLSGLTKNSSKVCVSFHRRPIVEADYGYGWKCFTPKEGSMEYAWKPSNDISSNMVGEYVVSLVLYRNDPTYIGGERQSSFASTKTFTIKP